MNLNWLHIFHSIVQAISMGSSRVLEKKLFQPLITFSFLFDGDLTRSWWCKKRKKATSIYF